MKDIFGHGGSRLFSSAMGKGTNYSVQGVTVANGLYPSAMVMVPLWTPAEIPGAVVFDAAESSSITLNGSAVTEWKDMLGSSIAATQGTPASQPTIGADEIVFAGDYLEIAGSKSADWVKALHSTGGHIFAIVRFGDSSDPNASLALAGSIAASSAEVGIFISYDDRASISRNNSLVTFVARGVAGQAPINTINQNVISPNTPQMLSVAIDPDNATAVERSKSNINEGTTLASNTNSYATSTANSTYDLQIGAAGGIALLTGAIKMIAFLPPITENDRLMLAGWAAHRHGQTALLPMSHPYKYVPPTFLR